MKGGIGSKELSEMTQNNEKYLNHLSLRSDGLSLVLYKLQLL